MNFFEGDEEAIVYQDHYLIKAYCERIEVPHEEYIKLFGQTSFEPLSNLLEYDIFRHYKQVFDQSTKIKNRKQSKRFQGQTEEEQSAELDSLFIDDVHAIEKDKLRYFILAHEQVGKVLIVNPPDDTEIQKQFLGYEWSDTKRHEGIKYNGGETVNDIITPLFDPKDLDNGTKINTAIKNNFSGEITDLPLKYCHYAKLTDMLDFSRTNFNKVISLNPNQNTDIETKWKLVKLEEVCKLYQPETITSDEMREGGDYKVYGANGVIGFYHEYNHELPEVVITCRGATCGTINFTESKAWITGNAMVAQPKNENILKKYLVEILEFCDLNSTITGTAQPQITRENLSPYKIPLPPLDIQQQIVDECDVVDQETDQAYQTIATIKQKIGELVNSVAKTSRLDQVVDRIVDIVNPNEEDGFVHFVGLENIESQTGVLLGDTQSDFSIIESNKNVFRRGDILYGKLRPNLNKVHLANIDGICSTDILVLRFC